MCGIAGIIGLKDRELAEKTARQMSLSLSHRGPDAEGFYIGDGVALIHRRLSIIDLSEEANQPQYDPSKRYAIIFNGEIYNYHEVKKQFPDYPYRTSSDTEVLLASYIAMGPGCLKLLNGMFSVAIWDTQEQQLFVARDRLGVKPLYYSIRADGVFVFSSEIRAMLESGLIPPNLDRHALNQYLQYQAVYSPNTIIENIYQLQAGNYGFFDSNGFRDKPYWMLEGDSSEFEEDDGLIRKNLREKLLSAVESRMISDVRLGAFLSGGIDSSAVVAMMAEVSDQPVDTFSVVFEEKEYDESRYSDLIAKKFNTHHTKLPLSANSFLENLPAALDAADSPSGDGLNTYVVSKAVKNVGLKVALSGIGGDELFAGYPNFLRWMKTQNGIFPKLPRILRKTVGAAMAKSRDSKMQRAGSLFSADKINIANVYPAFRQVMSRKNVDGLCQNGNGLKDIKGILNERETAISKFPFLSQYTIAELLGYTQNVLLKDTDQFSMASALEVREPFFDYRLVEYVLRIPDRLKFPAYPKSLLVESLAPLLPEKIVHRPKMGFVLPWEKWMRHELKNFCEVRIKNLADSGLINADQLMKKWNSFLNRREGVLASHLWQMIVLTEWIDRNGVRI